MAIPTIASIEDSSLVDFAELGFDTPAKLQRLVAVALRLVYRYTGQKWETAGPFAPASPLGVDDEEMVFDVVLQMVEFMAYRRQADIAETLGDFDLISSFNAGSYSETRRSGKDAQEASRAMLRGLLWPIMTPDKQDEWQQLDSGVNAPAFAVTEVDWQGSGVGSIYDTAAAEPYPTFESWDPYYDPRFG